MGDKVMNNAETMKALTLWQPWASLWVCGAKEFETRSWETSYRGPIAIHAGLAFNNSFPEEFAKAAHEALKKAIPSFTYIHELSRGAIIATAELIDCHQIVLHGGRGLPSTSPGWLETDRGIYEPTDQELLFGDWTPGRYAWEIIDFKMLSKPIPAKGKQGLWNWALPPAV